MSKRSVSTVTTDEPEPSKRKLIKSRTGCLTCKKKRLKCDEAKPFCQKCKSKGLICGGYVTNFVWKSFDELGPGGKKKKKKNKDTLSTGSGSGSMSGSPASVLDGTTGTLAGAIAAVANTNGSSLANPAQQDSLRKHMEMASLSITGKSISDIEIEHELISKGLNPLLHKMVKVEQQSDDEGYMESKAIKRTQSFSNEMHEANQNMLLSGSMNMRRSYSSNSAVAGVIQDLRDNLRKSRRSSRSGGLDSLANIAIEEISKGSPPLASDISGNIKLSPGTPGMGLLAFSPIGDFMKLPPADSKENIPPAMPPTNAEITQAFNFSPQLSALLNFALHDEGKLPGNTANINNNAIVKLPSDMPSPLSLSIPPQLAITGAEERQERRQSATSAPSPLSDVIMTLSSPKSSTSFNFFPHTPSPSTPANLSLLESGESEQILFLYSQYTCSIMSIKDGPNENPWRNMIVPLAPRYPCLFNSIASMTLFHLAGNSDVASDSANLRARGYSYMKKCILELASNLSRNSMCDESPELPADIVLAICLNLAVSESWDLQTSSGIAHLKGAKSMIIKVYNMLKDQRNSLMRKKDEIMKSGNTNKFKELDEFISNHKRSLKKKLVLLDDNELESIYEEDMEKNSNALLHTVPIPPSVQFLCNIWVYFEVLCHMTSDTTCDDKGVDLVATITANQQMLQNRKKRAIEKQNRILYGNETSPSWKSDTSELSFESNNDRILFENFDAFNFDRTEYVDPLLGCSQSLFLIMGKVANLIKRIRLKKSLSRNSLSAITLATQLRQQLIEWKPTITANMVTQLGANGMFTETKSNSSWDLSSCIATAEAYRYATLLYLHQAVPEIPSISSHQLAEKIFLLLASIPTTSLTYIIHIFPLLVSSCEAECGEEREWCRERWVLLAEKMWIGNIDRAFEVVKEVWKRKDEYMRKKREDDGSWSYLRTDDDDKTRNFLALMSGLMTIVNNDSNNCQLDDIMGGINSKMHWTSVMKEWGWEVLLG